MIITRFLGSTPLQIRSKPRQMYGRDYPGYQIVPYAYCLLDLGAEDDKSPSKVFRKNPGYISEEISKEVKWQLICRTNKEGKLVVVDESNHRMMNLYYRNDPDARPYIDKLPLLWIEVGMKFNLYWTYDYKQFKAARDKIISLYRKENQLHLCSTMLDSDEEKTWMDVFNTFLGKNPKMDARQKEDLVNYIKNAFFRKQKNYHRFVVRSGKKITGIDYRGTKFQITPNLELDDYDLENALMLSESIIGASKAPLRTDAFGHIARLEEVLRIIKVYEEKRKKEWINDIVGLHIRMEREDKCHSVAKWNIEQSFKRIANYIDECGKRLEPIYYNALLQAMDHYERKEAKLYIQQIQTAAGIYLNRQLWDNMISDKDKYEKKLAAIKEVINGKPPKDFLEKFISWYSTLDRFGSDKTPELIEKFSPWIDGLLPPIVKQKPAEVASALSRINHLTNCLENPNKIGEPVKEVFKVTKKSVSITVKNANFSVHETIGKIGEVAGRVGQIMNAVNLALSLKEMSENPDFKSTVKTFKDAAEAAEAFNLGRSQIMKSFGITENVLARIAGSAIIVVSIIDAGDHLTEGNNAAVLGDMLMTVGGSIKVLSKGGPWGWIAAAIIAGGVMTIYFSLNSDQKFLKHFNEKKYLPVAQTVHDHIFLRRQKSFFQPIDDYLKVRGN